MKLFIRRIAFFVLLACGSVGGLFAASVPSITLSQRQMCDLELIMSGGFYPITGFMNKADYDNVVHNMRLADGTIWPIPIVLDVDQAFINTLTDNKLELKSPDGDLLAVMQVQDIWQPDRLLEAEKVYGTVDLAHPGVDYLLNQTKSLYVGGPISMISMPHHFDFTDLRKTPEELKTFFKENDIDKVVAFQTRNPMHRAHQELTFRAAKQVGAHLLLQPVVGLTKPGDVDHFTRVKCYKKLLKYYPEGSVTLSLLPLAMRMAGPREALWHSIIRKNHGCSHFIVGRDHAGPGNDSKGKPFYDPYAAQEMVKKYAHEVGIEVVPFQEVVYVPEIDSYLPIDEISEGTKTMSISGTQLRAMLQKGEQIPSWFTYPDVAQQLCTTYPARSKQGITLFFTGLSGAGKSTIAQALALRLMEIQDRSVSLLDGDEVRKHLSSELGFSMQHRSLNVRRIGFVAHEISKNGGIALCSLIAPYRQDREYNRGLISKHGNYIEVYVSTSLAVCEERDVKGLYAKARAGQIPQFTGISDPYEEPINPELVIDTSKISLDQALDMIVNYLQENGFINISGAN